MIQVIVTDEFEAWYDRLSVPEQASLDVVVEMLIGAGVALPYPFSSSIRGSTHGLRELRPKRGRSPLRVFYAFDPLREAVLLFGGNKNEELYTRGVEKAEKIWSQYLADFRKKGRP